MLLPTNHTEAGMLPGARTEALHSVVHEEHDRLGRANLKEAVEAAQWKAVKRQ